MRRLLEDKTIVLGVTGSIAAFKSPHIVSRLASLGANVIVVMTENATRFVAPLTFETLSGNEVVVSMWPETRVSVAKLEEATQRTERLRHVRLAEAADLAIVAPATANIIGKMATGIADDFLSTELMAMTCPIIVAPAMNVNMIESDAVTANMHTLKSRGVVFVEAETGRLASGAVGPGRLADPDKIVDSALRILVPGDLSGRRVVVTAGPTEEPIDPVRHIGNRSTGKMGFALAERALARGAEVVLISGRTALTPPPGARFIQVGTTKEMRDAVMAELPDLELLVMAAAPSDYRPAEVAEHKIKKRADMMTLELVRTEDVLTEVAEAKQVGQGVVGFAVETRDEIPNARKKLEEKRLDLIVVNNPTVEGAGFGTDTNVVTIVGDSGLEESLGKMTKIELADIILTFAIRELGWGKLDE
ncbi:MAG: bifunctional phosphopantothenoylcysteine decarboxylase/phosphopantothenate--cysteine ligase CoaBC [Candidatus Eisenbacteria bacterium]|nr:bifunctional phosphopantothenoylcysteine decarboxylase/phosphopantothenate--cysteine ligase CoaBC [Candidatus Eisenbacteria bacterium]